MALERLGAQHMAVVDKYADPQAAGVAVYQMTTRDYVLRPDPVEAASAILVSLPPVALAKGRYYSIMAMDATNLLSVTVQDYHSTPLLGGPGLGDSESWQANVVFNEAGRGAVFYSDGQHWYFGSQAFTSSLIAGAVNIGEVSLTLDTAGLQTADALIVRLDSEVAMGNSAGAIFAQVNFSETVARVGGLAYAVGAEMILPNVAGIASGHYCCVDYELSAGDTVTWGGGTVVSYMRFAAWGTQTAVDDSAYWFTIAATTEAAHLASLNGQTLRCRIQALGVGNKERYVVLSISENFLDHLTDVVSGSFGLRSRGTVNDGHSDGGGAYIECSVTGTPDGHIMALGGWININAAPGAFDMRACDFGVYTAVDLTGAKIVNLSMQMHLGGGGAPVHSYQFEFNGSGYAVTGLFFAVNAGAVAYTVGTYPGAIVGKIMVNIAGQPLYIALYD